MSCEENKKPDFKKKKMDVYDRAQRHLQRARELIYEFGSGSLAEVSDAGALLRYLCAMNTTQNETQKKLEDIITNLEDVQCLILINSRTGIHRDKIINKNPIPKNKWVKRSHSNSI